MSPARPRPVKAILLDALGTLLELEPPAPFLVAEVSERFGIDLGEKDARRAIAAEIAYYRAHLDEGRDQQSLAALRLRCAEALLEAMPEDVRLRLPQPANMVEVLLASLNFEAYSEVRSVLGAFRTRGLRLVVVSNWDVSLHGVLERLGLSALLDGAVTSAEAGARKPSPAIFEQALRIAGVRAGEAVHVGDSLDEDVAGARAAGIEPVLVRRTEPVLASGSAAPGRDGVETVANLAELFV